jgi:transcription initiation factor TFIIIB Brf1 subunit/transcription initiation factor TFIIB
MSRDSEIWYIKELKKLDSEISNLSLKLLYAENKRDRLYKAAKGNPPLKYLQILYATGDEFLCKKRTSGDKFCFSLALVTQQLCQDLNLPFEAFSYCLQVICQIRDKGWYRKLQKKDILLLAGSLTYIAGFYVKNPRSQREITDKINRSVHGLRDNYKFLIYLCGIHIIIEKKLS